MAHDVFEQILESVEHGFQMYKEIFKTAFLGLCKGIKEGAMNFKNALADKCAQGVRLFESKIKAPEGIKHKISKPPRQLFHEQNAQVGVNHQVELGTQFSDHEKAMLAGIKQSLAKYGSQGLINGAHDGVKAMEEPKIQYHGSTFNGATVAPTAAPAATGHQLAAAGIGR